MELHLPPKPQPVVGPGEFQFAAVGLEHGHIYGMTNGLLEAGATLTAVWDEDPEKVAAYRRTFPQARAAASLDELLADPDIQLIASAAIPSERCPLGLRVMAAGKDYFVDKAPMTSLPQLEAARRAVAETGRKYMVYYSERLHSEAATLADYLIKQNTIGRVLHVEGFGPHRLGGPRPAWFYEKARYGGILCDIGSHQLEQFLYFAGVENADITFARKANYAHPATPEFEDFGECTATAANGGRITAATDVEYTPIHHEYHFDKEVYDNRLYYGFGKADPSVELVMGPNITDWPKMYNLTENLLVELAAVIHDPVTTTDELIPSGETSSYRSNPLRLAEFTLSRRVPEYVPRAKDVAAREAQRRSGQVPASLLETLGRVGDAQALAQTTQFGSCVFANKPGDGSAREQAASCQKVLGGFANICYEYATKRYRSNCINWGILPFTIDQGTPFDYQPGDCVFVPGIRAAIEAGREDIPAQVICRDGSVHDLLLHVRGLTQDEKEIILDGCLMNYYAARM